MCVYVKHLEKVACNVSIFTPSMKCEVDDKINKSTVNYGTDLAFEGEGRSKRGKV